MNKLIIIGASGHGKVIADIALRNGYEDIAFLDDDPGKKECAGFPVIGKTGHFSQYLDCDFIVAIGNMESRKRLQSLLPEDRVAILVHPNAVISRRVNIGKGTVVMAGAVINSDTVIGKGCIVNTCASIDHDNHLGDYVHVAVGAHLCGTVIIGNHTWVGAGATVTNNITVCQDSYIFAGAVVTKDIQESGKYAGIPAKMC